MTELPTFPGYQVLARLGDDKTGEAFKARRSSDDRVVTLLTLAAWETLIPPEREQFLAAVAPLRTLEHAAIAKLLDVNVEHRPPFVAVEFCEGIPLRECAKTLPFPAVAELMEKVARAVDHAHRAGILHADLHSEGVGVQPNLVPRLVDFGLARAYAEARTARTQRGAYVGHPAHAAPEQTAGERPTVRTDVYALGAILYELLAGQPPKAEAPSLPRDRRHEVPEPLQRVCLKALERVPTQRYASAAAFADDLARFRRGREVSARPSAYDRRLEERLGAQAAEVDRWRAERLIDGPTRDMLARALGEVRPAPPSAVSPTLPAILLTLGVVLVALGCGVGLATQWDRLPPAGRIAATWIPVVAAAVLAAARRKNDDVSAGLLAAGLLALAPAVAILLSELRYATLRVPSFDPFPTAYPTSFQMAVAGLTGLTLSAVAARALRRTVFVYLSAAYLAATYGAGALHLGLQDVIDRGPAVGLLYAALPLAGLAIGVAVLVDGSRRPSWAAPFYALGIGVALAAGASAMAWSETPFHGAVRVDPDEWIVILAASFLLCAVAAVTVRSPLHGLRVVSRVTLLLAPLGILAPWWVVADELPAWHFGGGAWGTAEDVFTILALALALLALPARSRMLLFWAAIAAGLAVWKWTDVRFGAAPAWPAGLLAGGILLAVLGLVLLRRADRR